MQLNKTINQKRENALQFVLDGQNASKLIEHDAIQATLPAEERTSFVPLTLEQYWDKITDPIFEDYIRVVEEDKAKKRASKLEKLSPEKQAAVDALINAG